MGIFAHTLTTTIFVWIENAVGIDRRVLVFELFIYLCFKSCLLPVYQLYYDG